MDRTLFIEKYADAEPILASEANDIIEASLNACDWKTKSMIVMEELAELAQEVSKGAREEEYDVMGLLEEMADVRICFDFLIKHFGITNEMLMKATSVKLHREAERRGLE